jgi:hypothetical protein
MSIGGSYAEGAEIAPLRWFASYRADVARYRANSPRMSSLGVMVLNQGLWALWQCRVAHGLYRSRCLSSLKRPLPIDRS